MFCFYEIKVFVYVFYVNVLNDKRINYNLINNLYFLVFDFYKIFQNSNNNNCIVKEFFNNKKNFVLNFRNF